MKRTKYLVLLGLSLVAWEQASRGQERTTLSRASSRLLPSVGGIAAPLRGVAFSAAGAERSGRLGPLLPPSASRVMAAGGAGVRQQSVAMSLLVDGAKTPEQIPDDVAYRHFISVTAIRAGAPAEHVAHREAFLSRVQFPADDRTAYITALQNVREQLTLLEQQELALGRTADAPRSAIAELKRQRTEVLDGAATLVKSSLSTAGQMRFKKHIDEHVKRQTRIYGEPQHH